MREMTGSWLSGPASATSDGEQAWRGERLGLPRSGLGSLASLGRRFGGLTIDWLLCYAVVLTVFSVAGTDFLGGGSAGAVASWLVPVVWTALGVTCVTLFAQTPGQAILGMGTARVDAEERVGLWRSALRTVLILVLLPPLLQDEDGRGMHDRATGTALIRTR